MQSEFKEVEITDTLILDLFKNEVLRNAFEAGGWIGGGFARLVGKQMLIPHKFDFQESNREKLIGRYFETRGDIDFFFRNEKDYMLAQTVRAYHKSAFAHNVWLNNNNGALSIKVQLVNKFFYDDIKSTFDSFDFLNSCYAIKKKKHKYFLVFDSAALHADEKKELIIKHSNSPYTLQRVLKYLNKRGVKSISKSSNDILTEILIRNAAGAFDSKYGVSFKPFIEKTVKSIFALNIINPENAVYFLGKFKKVHTQKYGPTYVTDWASGVIEESANTQQLY